MPAFVDVTSPPTHNSGNVTQTSSTAARCGQRLGAMPDVVEYGFTRETRKRVEFVKRSGRRRIQVSTCNRWTVMAAVGIRESRAGPRRRLDLRIVVSVSTSGEPYSYGPR